MTTYQKGGGVQTLWLPIFALRMAGPAAGMYCTKTNFERFEMVFCTQKHARNTMSKRLISQGDHEEEEETASYFCRRVSIWGETKERGTQRDLS